MTDVDKASPKATSTMKNKKKEKNNKNGKKDEQLVLTPSEKELGIQITQTKQKTVDTMMRLYAVPSEKLRVWTCWLTKVGERADDWQWWLRAQIGLTLRISDHLQKAVSALENEKNDKLDQGDGGKSDAAATVTEIETHPTAPEVNGTDSTGVVESTPASEQETPVTKEEVPVELKNTDTNTTKVPGGDSADAQQPGKISETKSSRGRGDKTKGIKGKKSTKADKLVPKIVYKEGFWPIGVRWKPLSQRGEPGPPPPQRKPDDIPIPPTEEEMTILIKKFKHQGVIFRSLYKHWSETADEALKQIVGRKVLPTKQVYSNGEEVPFFFYLESEPDMNYVIECDDEEVLLPDPGREKITHEFTHLYFNISDKPGKGGKPWI